MDGPKLAHGLDEKYIEQYVLLAVHLYIIS